MGSEDSIAAESTPRSGLVATVEMSPADFHAARTPILTPLTEQVIEALHKPYPCEVRDSTPIKGKEPMRTFLLGAAGGSGNGVMPSQGRT